MKRDVTSYFSGVLAVVDVAAAAEANGVPQRLLACLTQLEEHICRPSAAPSPAHNPAETLKHSRYREQFQEKITLLQGLYERAVRISPCPAMLIRDIAAAMTKGEHMHKRQPTDMEMREYIDDVQRLVGLVDAMEALDGTDDQQTRCDRVRATCASGFNPQVLEHTGLQRWDEASAPETDRLHALFSEARGVGKAWQFHPEHVRKYMEDISYSKRWWALVRGGLGRDAMDDSVFTECLSNVSSAVYLQYAAREANDDDGDAAKLEILPLVITEYGRRRQTLLLGDGVALNDVGQLQRDLASATTLTRTSTTSLLSLWPMVRALEERQTEVRRALRPWHDAPYTDTFTPPALRLADAVAAFDSEAHASLLKLELCQRAVEDHAFDEDAIEQEYQR